jgi:hypothetical protein
MPELSCRLWLNRCGFACHKSRRGILLRVAGKIPAPTSHQTIQDGHHRRFHLHRATSCARCPNTVPKAARSHFSPYLGLLFFPLILDPIASQASSLRVSLKTGRSSCTTQQLRSQMTVEIGYTSTAAMFDMAMSLVLNPLMRCIKNGEVDERRNCNKRTPITHPARLPLPDSHVLGLCQDVGAVRKRGGMGRYAHSKHGMCYASSPRQTLFSLLFSPFSYTCI